MTPHDWAGLVTEAGLLKAIASSVVAFSFVVFATFFWMVRRMFNRLMKGDGNGAPSIQKVVQQNSSLASDVQSLKSDLSVLTTNVGLLTDLLHTRPCVVFKDGDCPIEPHTRKSAMR